MERNIRTIDISNIPGTNCYCDTGVICAARSLISDTYVSDIRFLGSGNYHYLSYFSAKRITEDFALVLIDNHPDMQPPAFGDILSCGGWVADCLRDIPNMKKVYMIGVSPILLEELEPLDERIEVIPENAWRFESDAAEHDRSFYHLLPHHEQQLPIFISLDKDALSTEYARCDWDQGNMTLDELTAILTSLISDYRIIGVDVCGNKKDSPTQEDEAVNHKSDLAIQQLF